MFTISIDNAADFDLPQKHFTTRKELLRALAEWLGSEPPFLADREAFVDTYGSRAADFGLPDDEEMAFCLAEDGAGYRWFRTESEAQDAQIATMTERWRLRFGAELRVRLN